MSLRWLAALAVLASAPALAQEPKDNIAGPYVPTPWVIVDAMLNLADIRADDVVYDLGSGDGRLVITAAKRYKARGVGVELQPELVEMANAAAKKEEVADRVKFIQGDLFETDIGDATVVTLFLFESLNRQLLPKLRKDLKPGTRIVAHRYGFGNEWPPEKTVQAGASTLYLWTVPAR